MKPSLALVLFNILLQNVGKVAATDEVRISGKCTNLPPQISQQAYGFDVTDKNPRGPNLKSESPKKLKPVFQYSCDKYRGYQDNLTTRDGKSYRIPDQLTAHPRPYTGYNSAPTLCFNDYSSLMSRLYNDVGEWEKYPTGTFVSTTGNSSSILNIPHTARCLESFSKEVLEFTARPESRFYFNETHPLLDPKLEALLKLISEDTTDNSTLYTELIQNYGTSYWKSASYGYAIHIYILTEKQVEFPRTIYDFESILTKVNYDSMPESPADWVKDQVEQEPDSSTPPTILIRSSNIAPFSNETNFVDGELALLVARLFHFTSEKKGLIEHVLRNYRAKAGMHKHSTAKQGDKP